MTITIGSFSASTLLAQPIGYEGDARDGFTARTFTVSGLLTPAQWQALVTEYNTWRTARIADPDTMQSATVGSTVNLSIANSYGLTITSLPCWFVDPPSGEQAGTYISATTRLVDAAQALAVLLREEEKSRQESEAKIPSLGTITLGTAVVTLTEPADARQDGPTVAMTATGVSYVTGPLTAHKVRNIRGNITTGTPTDVLTWYDTTISTVPAAGAWFPVSSPEFTSEVIITNGAKATRYSVNVTAVQII